MDKGPDQTFDDIEETQAALRDSIEQAKALTEKSERLIKQYRGETREAAPAG
ncbi:MAG: hypothetical protein J7498_12885 [Sphingobium sp.]|nr:hypothetical protein [Sphingobium sp.]